MKHCIQCHGQAEYSVCSIISTVGRTSRQQRCTSSVAFCGTCLQKLCTSGGAESLSPLAEALRTALEALTMQSVKRSRER